jgi:PAS domain S-box-containing protein
MIVYKAIINFVTGINHSWFSPLLLVVTKSDRAILKILSVIRFAKMPEAENSELKVALEQQVDQLTTQLEVANSRSESLLLGEQRVESAIAHTERLTLALDAAKMGWWDLDLATGKTLWNTYHEVIFGYEPGTPERDYFDWEQRVHPDDLERMHQATHWARDHREDLSIQYRILWPDGSLHWINAFSRFIYGAAGAPVRMLGVLTDITERKQAELSLLESEERFRVTFEQAPVGIAHVDLDGHWLRVNQTLCDIVGYTREELVSKTFQDITYPDDLGSDLDHVRQLLAGEIENYVLEKRYLHKNGQIIWANLTVSLLRQLEDIPNAFKPTQAIFPIAGLGQPKYFISIVEDISDRKQTELRLQERSQELADLNTELVKTSALLTERNQELDRFVYIVSHDLKAPLRGIANLTEWIEDDLGGQLPTENQKLLALMRAQVNRMDAMINGLLEYSKAGRVELTIESIDISALLAEILNFIEVPPGFKIKIDTQVTTLRTRRILLYQVLLNLISNAIKHHDRPDGQLEIGVYDLGDRYEFWVQDDGPGIPPEHRERIFEIFQTLKSSNESTGIGLSIVKKIVEAEGGTVEITSEVDVGSKFRFTWLKESASEIV